MGNSKSSNSSAAKPVTPVPITVSSPSSHFFPIPTPPIQRVPLTRIPDPVKPPPISPFRPPLSRNTNNYVQTQYNINRRNNAANLSPFSSLKNSFVSSDNLNERPRSRSRPKPGLRSQSENVSNNEHRNRKYRLTKPTIRLLELIFEKELKNNVREAYKLYPKLRTKIIDVNTNSPEYRDICKYLQNTRGPTHNFRVNVEHVFTAARRGEIQIFYPKKALGNRKLLWHGTKLSNLKSILENGLQTQPPSNVEVTGKMFGEGIYFADVITKAAQYCRTTSADPYGVLILAQVALGKHYYKTKSEKIYQLPEGKHSVKGLGRYKPKHTETVRGKFGVQIPLGELEFRSDLQTNLDYNEYIVYDNSQILIEYLVTVKIDHNFIY